MDLNRVPFLLVLFQLCITKSNGSRPTIPPFKIKRQQIIDLQKLALIKKVILSQLGKSDTPKFHNTIRKSMPKQDDTVNMETEYKVTDVSSYHSEPPDNFSDENIIQFSLFNRINGKPIKVENVNLLVRVKLRKPRTNKKSTRDMNTRRKKKQRRRKKFKEVDIIVSNVTSKGEPDKVIASVKSKIRKTTSFKLSIPKNVIQKVLDSNKNRLQFFIECLGCDKKAKIILVYKKRNRKSTKTRDGNTRVKLHKRRPMLFIYSHITNGS